MWNGTESQVLLTIIVNPDGFERPFSRDSVTTFFAPSDDRNPAVSEVMVDGRPAVLIMQSWPNASGGTTKKLEAMIDFGATTSVIVSMANSTDLETAQSEFQMALSAISFIGEP